MKAPIPLAFGTVLLVAGLAPSAVALPSFSGTIRDTKGPIDGAKVTLWDATTGRGLQTSSSKGLFSLSNVTEGDYLFKVESDGCLLLPCFAELPHEMPLLSGDRFTEGFAENMMNRP